MGGQIAKQAIVIGGSIAGLSAARALSPYFEKVIVVERDASPNNSEPRKAVPQGYHAHALLKGGELALEKLFPDLCNELISCGATRIDFSKDVRWFHSGQWKMRYASGFEIMIQTRPLLEQVIRNRVKSLGNVSFQYGYEVETLRTSPDKTKIMGVSLQKMENRSQKLDLDSDLLIDASGRGSKMPQWLEALGYAAPTETRLKIDLTYSSRLFEAPKQVYDWKLLLLNPYSPDVLRAGYIFPVEDDKWLITFGGYSGDAAPKDNDSFLDYAKGLVQPDIYEVMQNLKPIGDVKVYSIPQTVRRHYENLSNFPQALLVMGDAFCAFDPVFGQGMSAASTEAWALHEMLAHENSESIANLGKRFHRKAAQIIFSAWLLASSEDFRYPKTVGEKSPLIPVLHWYSNHIFNLSATDKDVYAAFLQVMHLIEGAEALFKPNILFKVLKHAVAN